MPTKGWAVLEKATHAIQLDEDAKVCHEHGRKYRLPLQDQRSGTELHDEDEDQRDPLAQLQATKTLLSETQRIAYVGMTRLAICEDGPRS